MSHAPLKPQIANPEPLHALIVEDDDIDFEQLKRFLESSSEVAQIWHAPSLEEAIACLDREAVDVVVLDLNLPDTDNLDSVRTITAMYPDLPIIVVTGHDTGRLGLEAIALGAEDYLIKREFHAETLTKSIRYSHQRKKTEERAKRAYRELEQANKELKKTQMQLIQNEKLASIGQLAAGVAHEMNTPVGFVASNFQTLYRYMDRFSTLFTLYEELAEAVENGQKDQRLAKIQEIQDFRQRTKFDFIMSDLPELFRDSKEGLERITDIIQNLRDFSRVDQQRDVAEYDVNEGIRATLVVARNEVKYDAEVQLDLACVTSVMCHSGQINQVFLNLLVNAAQAIKSQEREEKGTISIRSHETEDHIVCEVGDDGPGIPPETLSKVFDPFFTTKPPGKGTGLGLSLSYDIVVNKHKGQLSVESEVERGTTFYVKLPKKNNISAGEKGECDETADRLVCG